MDTQAPAVVAVVVTSNPDERLEETLASLEAQDYESLRTLVLIGDGGNEVSDRVAAVSPTMFVAHLEEDRGFGAAVNRALEIVQGAAFLVLCHDDVVLAPDAIHLMVEESFRSNAGIVTPKVVSTEDPTSLLHVGQGTDRFGTVIERVLPGEVDQGQHDAVRDVFVAPGGVTLVRDDLLRSIGGFDERYVAMGDDLEFSWRARLAGARIVCAPQAVVAHSERLAAGERSLPVPAGGGEALSLSRLHRRNELQTLLICWGGPERAFTLALLALLNLGEIAVAAVGGDHARAVDIREAWRQAWRDRRRIRDARRRAQALRTVSDRDVRSFQAHGATRFRRFATNLLHHGYDAARGVLPVEEVAEDVEPLSSSFGGAFSDDQGFDELDDLGHRSGPRRRGRHRLSSARSLFMVSLVAIAIYTFGCRNLLGARLPMIGQLVPLGSWLSTWHRVVASWQPTGLGSGTPGSPGYATFGLFGTLTFGQMGVLEHLLIFAAVPIGAIGVFRLLSPVASNRARVLAALAFGGLSLGMNDIATGRIGGLVALAATPFILRRLLRICRITPFDDPFPPSVRFATKGWRRSARGQVVTLGLLLALVSSVAPAVLVVTIASSIGIALTALVQPGGRPLAGQGRVLGALVLALVLLAPLTVPVVLGGTSGLAVFGVAGGPWSMPGIGGLVRFAVGPNGGGALAWLLPVAAVVPLLIARERRLGLAARLSGAGLACLALALFVSRGGWGPFAPDVFVLLAPVATVIAVLVGLGLAALEMDVAEARFGWRQVIGTLGVAAALVGLLPALGSVGNGRWKMPTAGYGETLAFLSSQNLVGHRVLWLGDPRSVPGSSWPLEPGLAWSTSADGLPGGANLFAPPTATAASAITSAVNEALAGQTVHLGQLLSPAGIVAIVVTTAVAPTLPGLQTGESTPPPASVLPALTAQGDLVQVPGGGGASIFENPSAMAVVSTRALPLTPQATLSSSDAVLGWSPLSTTTPLSGVVPSGHRTAFVGLAPSSAFSVHGGSSLAPAFGWAQSASVNPGPLEVSLSVPPYDALAGIAMLVAWLAAGLALLGRHRWLDWWWTALRARARRPKGSDGPEELPEAVLAVGNGEVE